MRTLLRSVLRSSLRTVLVLAVRRLWLLSVAMLLVACGSQPAAAPATVQTPTVDIAPTETRVAELAQLATLTAPTATAIPATATAMPTNTPRPPTATVVPPTPTPEPSTPTPVPPTPTAVPVPQATLTVTPSAAPAGTIFSFRVFPSSLSDAASATIIVVDDRGATKPQGRVQSAVTRVDRQWTFNSAGDVPCTCTAYFMVDGKRVAEVSFIVRPIPATTAYRTQNDSAIRRMHSALEGVAEPCAFGNAVACDSAIQRGLPNLVAGAAALRALSPPPGCELLHAASLRLALADEAFFAKLRAQGPQYNLADVLLATQGEVAAVNDAKREVEYLQQYSNCR